MRNEILFFFPCLIKGSHLISSVVAACQSSSEENHLCRQYLPASYELKILYHDKQGALKMDSIKRVNHFWNATVNPLIWFGKQQRGCQSLVSTHVLYKTFMPLATRNIRSLLTIGLISFLFIFHLVISPVGKKDRRPQCQVSSPGFLRD